jgi:hypothetical protein
MHGHVSVASPTVHHGEIWRPRAAAQPTDPMVSRETIPTCVNTQEAADASPPAAGASVEPLARSGAVFGPFRPA